MKKFAYFWVALVLIALTAQSSFARGAYYGKDYINHQGKRSGMLNTQSPGLMAYRAILRASNSIYVAKAYANYVKDGKFLMKKSEHYYDRAEQLYKHKKYRQAADYALSSMCINRTILHIYKANHPVVLPQPPQYRAR